MFRCRYRRGDVVGRAWKSRIPAQRRPALRLAGSNKNGRQQEVGSGVSVRRLSEGRARERRLQEAAYLRSSDGRHQLHRLSQATPLSTSGEMFLNLLRQWRDEKGTKKG